MGFVKYAFMFFMSLLLLLTGCGSTKEPNLTQESKNGVQIYAVADSVEENEIAEDSGDYGFLLVIIIFIVVILIIAFFMWLFSSNNGR